MYGNTAEAAEARESITYQAIQAEVGSCREWIDEKNNRCGLPAEFVLWGKLIDPDGLGPRCYDCAVKHVGHRALQSDQQSWAIIDIGRLARQIDKAHYPHGYRT